MKRAILLFSIAACFGCSTRGPLFHDSGHTATISASSYELSLIDKRARVDARSLSIPAVTFPGQKVDLAPPLDAELRALARATIDRCVVPGPHALVFTINVLEGRQGFVAHALSEEESVSLRLQLEVRLKEMPDPLSISDGASWGTRSSLDASPARIQKMYRQSFEQALLEALSRVAE